MARVSRFQQTFRRGTPTYTCRICKHVTRETGDGEASVQLCAPCFNLAGLENTVSDCGIEGIDACEQETIKADIALVEKRTGGDHGWRQTFAAILR